MRDESEGLVRLSPLRMTARRCLTVQLFTGRAGKRVRPGRLGSVRSPRSISEGVCGSNLTLVNRKREGVTRISKGAGESEGNSQGRMSQTCNVLGCVYLISPPLP